MSNKTYRPEKTKIKKSFLKNQKLNKNTLKSNSS